MSFNISNCKSNNYREYSKLDEIIYNICNNDCNYFLNKQHVVGVGVGFKRKNNFYTCKKCLQVFVIKKIPSYKLLSNDIIPSYFKGIPTDVIETGVFSECSLRTPIRPVQGGYAISYNNSYFITGTAGCLVSNGIRNFVLSTNHTLARENEIPIGFPILQPSYEYGGRAPKSIIGQLYKFVPLRFIIDEQHQPINLSDAAIAELTSPNILSPEIAFIGKLTCVKNPKLNDHVRKVGSTSELTEGTVISIHATIIINYISSEERYKFSDITLTTKMSDLGDSGSILVTNSKCAIGLLSSQSDANTAYCNLNTVLSQLDVHIVT